MSKRIQQKNMTMVIGTYVMSNTKYMQTKKKKENKEKRIKEIIYMYSQQM